MVRVFPLCNRFRGDVLTFFSGTFLPFGNTALSDELFSGRYVKLDPIDHIRFVEDPSRLEA